MITFFWQFSNPHTIRILFTLFCELYWLKTCSAFCQMSEWRFVELSYAPYRLSHHSIAAWNWQQCVCFNVGALSSFPFLFSILFSLSRQTASPDGNLSHICAKSINEIKKMAWSGSFSFNNGTYLMPLTFGRFEKSHVFVHFVFAFKIIMLNGFCVWILIKISACSLLNHMYFVPQSLMMDYFSHCTCIIPLLSA